MFSIINFADSTITNIGARQHEIGLLQAVGMTNKQVQIMLKRKGNINILKVLNGIAVIILLKEVIIQRVGKN